MFVCLSSSPLYLLFSSFLPSPLATVTQEHDIEESELEEAAMFYSQRGDGKLKEIISKIQLMHKQFGGENPSTQRGGAGGGGTSTALEVKELSLARVIQLLKSLSEKVNSATDQFIDEFIETHGQPSPSNMMYFQQGMLQLSERSAL
jgi:hypothetical protein